MGTYSYLTIADFPYLIYKYDVYPESMTIFDETDKRIYKRKLSERNVLVWGKCEKNEVEEIETAYEYRNTVKIIKERLEVMGFSIKNIKKEFDEAKAFELEYEKGEFSPKIGDSDEYAILKSSNFEDFVDSFREIRELQLQHSLLNMVSFNEWLENKYDKKVPPLIEYILKNDYRDELDAPWPYGYPCNNIRSFLRAVIESCSPEEYVVQEITDLFQDGLYHHKDEVSKWQRQNLIENFEIDSKIIILVEGKSDRKILERSLHLLYPHLSSYYSFMDFQGSNSDGGASFLVSQIKSLVGAGVANRVIALFDLDTAGTKEIKRLGKVKLPSNYKVFQYPKLPLACDYPTIGPTGIINHDINGLACSIELYLGIDVLKKEDEFIPIQWKGHDPKLNRYHGEIINKSDIQKSYYDKLKECEDDEKKIDKYDWSGIELILNQIFSAYC